jgi:hypothetical protein
MRKTITTFFGFFFYFILSAGPGDTTIIQTIDFNTPVNPGWNAPREGTYLFPPDSISYHKILMYYTLKCDPGQNPACGEWDYITNTYLKYHTGQYDSNLLFNYNYVVNGATPDTFHYMDNLSWNYHSYFEYFNQTTPGQTITIGNGSSSANLTQGPSKEARHQYLFLGSELAGAGLGAGEITGLQFNFTGLGSYLKRFRIAIKATDSASIHPGNMSLDEFTEVFNRGIDITSTGWNTIPFAWPFPWDGTSNLILDISYENHDAAGEYLLASDDAGFNTGVVSNEKDHFLEFDGTDYVDIPVDPFDNLDSAITVTFWHYGDPAKQPQNDILFEARDQYNRRVLNVHLPWSDSKVYWDAGRDEDGYDRIHRTAPPEEYEGRWNHWAFIKDCTAGEMSVYLNGELWNFALGKYKLMDSITKFRIGASPTNSSYYDGMIDEFRVWNKKLDEQEINNWMHRDVTPDHPDYNHLLAYYRFNEGEGLTTTEEMTGSTAMLRGYPQWMDHNGHERFRNFVQQNQRPQIKFESGNYNASNLDSLVMVDTIPKGELMIVMYEDTLDPTTPTDTLSKWPSYYHNYIYDPNGVATDSTFVSPDGTLIRDTLYYYGEPYEILVNYELGRFITPYGIGLDLGDGWTWIYDVTDFRPLLADSVHLTAGNFQELLDLKFYMIEGTPPREVKNIQKLWHGTYSLNNFETLVPPDTVGLHPDAENWKLKITTSGHDFDNSTNCAEFCQKTHWVDVNGNEEYSWEIIDECGDNPLYPQGGTWIYDRAGWCPGDKVTERHLELTPFISGTSAIIDYNCESDPYGRYRVSSYLFEYGAPSFILDAAVEEITSPNKMEIYSRFNPMCGKPEVIIRNTGSSTLSSLEIEYGPEGGVMQTYNWSGSLEMMDTAHVTLDPIDWTDWYAGSNRFVVNIGNPNGGQDEYAYNNTMVSEFNLAPEFPNEFIVRFRSNKRPWENRWEIRDSEGNLVVERDTFDPETEYRDTLLLDDGCYTFMMTDSENDGISFWAHGFQGSGFVQFREMDDSMLHNFDPDFGAFTSLNFSVGLAVATQEIELQDFVDVYPNPASDFLNLSFALRRPGHVMVQMFNYSGQQVFAREFSNINNQTVRLGTGSIPEGVYLCRIMTPETTLTRKIVISR